MRRCWAIPLLFVPTLLSGAAVTSAELAVELRQGGLDQAECYHVRDLFLGKDELRFYFNDGFLIFGPPIHGRRISAVFFAGNEGGDGEILLMPPTRGERLSLATYTDSPNLNEHFDSAVMLFSDNTAEDLLAQIRERGIHNNDAERGALLARQYGSVVNNLASSFGARLLADVLAERPLDEGFFYAGIGGNTHGVFDVVFDPESRQQIAVGTVQTRGSRTFFDVWTHFTSRSFRTGNRKPVETFVELSDYRIEATLQPDLDMTVVTRAALEAEEGSLRVLSFEIAPEMRITQVLIDGQSCEFWQRESLRADLFRGGVSSFLVVLPAPLSPGSHSVEFHQEGRVVSEEGNDVFSVNARTHWFPHHGVKFSNFDITFRYPSDLDMVFSGEIVEDRTDGAWHITRRVSENPALYVGFNVGKFKHASADYGSGVVEVYANREIEEELEEPERMLVLPRSFARNLPDRGNNAQPLVTVPAPSSPSPNPTARLQSLATEISEACQFMTELFGPPPTSTLLVSPLPGIAGQGFAGLLYLSTLAYLSPSERPEQAQQGINEIFFSRILSIHEAAHQWWGNSVSTDDYRDEWLMEALANYTALLLVERQTGRETLSQVLNEYRRNLLAKSNRGKTVDSTGPISWGMRLDSSQTDAWRVITYEKGSWIIHMLRRRMGDERFLKMLGDLAREFRFRVLTTNLFREHAAKYMPEDDPDPSLENFFTQWVDDTGIPTLSVVRAIRDEGADFLVTVTLSQSGVASDFSAWVPVQFRFPSGEEAVHWVLSGQDPQPVQFTFPERPNRVVVNPDDTILAVRD